MQGGYIGRLTVLLSAVQGSNIGNSTANAESANTVLTACFFFFFCFCMCSIHSGTSLPASAASLATLRNLGASFSVKKVMASPA